MGWAVYSGWGPKLAAHPRAGDRRLPGVRGGCTTGPGGRAPLQTLLVSAQTAGGLSSEVLQSKKRRWPTLTSRVARGWGRWRRRFVGGWRERERETKGAGRPFFSQCAELVGAPTPSPGRKHTWGRSGISVEMLPVCSQHRFLFSPVTCGSNEPTFA